MKAKVFFTISIVLGFLFFYSCENSDNLITENQSVELSAKMANDRTVNGGVEFQCIGSCNCGFGLDLNTMTGACSCSPCALELKFTKINNQVLSDEDKEVLTNNFYQSKLLPIAVEDLTEYALDKYDTEISNFRKVEFYHNNGTDVLIFTFEDRKGDVQTVLYSLNHTIAKAFRVDCTGSCDCREQFNFNTNTASCSCSDCTMTVTEIKDLTLNP